MDAALVYALPLGFFGLFYLAMLYVPKSLVWPGLLLMILLCAVGVSVRGSLPQSDTIGFGLLLATAGILIGTLVRHFGPSGKRDLNYWIGATIIGALGGFFSIFMSAMTIVSM